MYLCLTSGKRAEGKKDKSARPSNHKITGFQRSVEKQILFCFKPVFLKNVLCLILFFVLNNFFLKIFLHLFIIVIIIQIKNVVTKTCFNTILFCNGILYSVKKHNLF